MDLFFRLGVFIDREKEKRKKKKTTKEMMAILMNT